MTPDPVNNFSYLVEAVTRETAWTFLQVETLSGIRGVGEATSPGPAEQRNIECACRDIADLAFSLTYASPNCLPLNYQLNSLAMAAAYSALDQALWDIEGQRQERSVAELLAAERPLRTSISLYANVNRRTKDRSLKGFVDSAKQAVAAGFDAIKIAPFDDVNRRLLGTKDVYKVIDSGLARVAAVRDAIGPQCDLLVDCHWRFDRSAATHAIRELAAYQVHWVECPVPEVPANFPLLKRLRSEANLHGMRLAGAELHTRRAGFRPLLECGAYDVMMPDAKYAGGLFEMTALAQEFERAAVCFSPHNPSGPVCHAASLQVCSVAAALDRLEVQFDETPEFTLLQARRLPQFAQSRSALPTEPGLGLSLDGNRAQMLAREIWVRRRK